MIEDKKQKQISFINLMQFIKFFAMLMRKFEKNYNISVYQLKELGLMQNQIASLRYKLIFEQFSIAREASYQPNIEQLL